jgi:hypothetical protein
MLACEIRGSRSWNGGDPPESHFDKRKETTLRAFYGLMVDDLILIQITCSLRWSFIASLFQLET